jgi:flagellar basal body-associated protein FliL
MKTNYYKWSLMAASLLAGFALVLPTYAQPKQGPESANMATNAAPSSRPSQNAKNTVLLSDKILVNLAESKLTRYLLAQVGVEGDSPAFAEMVKANDAALRDAAGDVLSSRTISDLEKPGAMVAIRAELLSEFNRILGAGMVKRVYLPELSVQ